ncbi:MAG: type I 3-dehydroquinate dehydratase [Verrucomicrobiota bacterium]
MSQQPGKSIDLTSPLIVGIVTDSESLDAVTSSAESASFCDLLEIRLDAFPNFDTSSLKALNDNDLPKLFTARDPIEKGMNSLSVEHREQLLRLALPFANLIDVELRNFEQMKELIEDARRSGVSVVGSFHDFDRFPEDTVRTCFANTRSADVVKIAVHLDTENELDVLEDAFRNRQFSTPAAFMGMGPLGQESRLRALRLGSVLNYGFLGAPNAPGQWSARELREHLDKMERP